jgi:hypothetical protein
MPNALREMRPTTSAPAGFVHAFTAGRAFDLPDLEPRWARDAAQRDVASTAASRAPVVDDTRRAELHPRVALGVEHDPAAQERVAKIPAGADRARVDLEVDALDAALRIHLDRSRRASEPPVLLLDAELRNGEPRCRAVGIDAKRRGAVEGFRSRRARTPEASALQKEPGPSSL